MLYGIFIGMALAIACVFYALGKRSYIRKVKPLGTLMILIDEQDGSRYPLVELNNDTELWKLKTGDVAMFIAKRKDA